MKNRFRILAATILLVLAGFAAWDAFIPSRAQAQQPVGMGAPSSFFAMTNLSSLIASNATTTINTGQFPLRGTGVALLPSFAGSNSGTANITFNFQVSADGTNWSTISPFSIVAPMNGTAGVIVYTNWGAPALNNVRWMRLGSWQNAHTANCFLTNILVSTFNN